MTDKNRFASNFLYLFCFQLIVTFEVLKARKTMKVIFEDALTTCYAFATCSCRNQPIIVSLWLFEPMNEFHVVFATLLFPIFTSSDDLDLELASCSWRWNHKAFFPPLWKKKGVVISEAHFDQHGPTQFLHPAHITLQFL